MPPFQSKQLLTFLKDMRKKVSFIAPEICEGKNSNNADSWSIGVLQYWMRYDMLPQFDNHDMVIIPNRDKFTNQALRQLTSLLQKDPKERKMLTGPSILSLQEDQQVDQSRQIFNKSVANRKFSEFESRSPTSTQKKVINKKDKTVGLSRNKDYVEPLQIKDNKVQKAQKIQEQKKPKEKPNQQQPQSSIKGDSKIIKIQSKINKQQNDDKLKEKSSRKQKIIKQQKQKKQIDKSSQINKKKQKNKYDYQSNILKNQIGQKNQNDYNQSNISGSNQISQSYQNIKYDLNKPTKINKVNNNQKLKTITKQKNLEMIEVQQINKPIQPSKPFGLKLYQKFKYFCNLQKNWTKPLRILIKCIIGLIFYIFLFYFPLFKNDGKLIGQRYIYQNKTIEIRAFETDSIPNINYNLVTKTPTQTYTLFYNSTLKNLRDNYTCVLNTYSVQSDIVQVLNSTGFQVYQVFGILISITNLFFLCLILSKLDFPKLFNLIQFQQNNFIPLLNFILVQIVLSSLTSMTYLIYGSFYHLSTQPCFKKPLLPALQFIFKRWVGSFVSRFIWIYLGYLVCYGLIIYLIIRPSYKNHIAFYIVFGCLYIAGIGCRGMGGFVSGSVESVFGILGELLTLFTGLIFLLIDFIFSCCLRKFRSVPEQDKNEPNNKTQAHIFQINDDISDE